MEIERNLIDYLSELFSFLIGFQLDFINSFKVL
jgi:hypothetical protein